MKREVLGRPLLTGRQPQRRHESSRLNPGKSRQPVMKLAALQTNGIKARVALNLTDPAVISRGLAGKLPLISLQTPFLMSSL